MLFLFELLGISLAELSALFRSRLHIGHVLMLVASLLRHIEFLQIEGILPALQIVVTVILCAPDDGLLRRIPRLSVSDIHKASPPKTALGRGLIAVLKSLGIEIVIKSRVFRILSADQTAAALASLLLNQHRR